MAVGRAYPFVGSRRPTKKTSVGHGGVWPTMQRPFRLFAFFLQAPLSVAKEE